MFSFLNKKDKKLELKAFISGKVIPIEEVKDEVFASRMLGGGVAIEPEGNLITAPCDGVISVVMEDSKHAFGMTLSNGAEILIHEGLDTVKLNGEGFKLHVCVGQKVKTGERLLEFNKDLIIANGCEATCVLIITNESQFSEITYLTGIDAKQGETVIMQF